MVVVGVRGMGLPGRLLVALRRERRLLGAGRGRAMTVPTTAAFVACSHCRRFLPVETLREYRGGNRRLMRYCPTCWEQRTQAIAALKKGRPDGRH